MKQNNEIAEKWKWLALGSIATLGVYVVRDFLQKRGGTRRRLQSEAHQDTAHENIGRSKDGASTSFVFDEDVEPRETIVKKICVTGGPCAGKTTALARISHRLRERGYNVYIVPEAATTISEGGGFLLMEKYTRTQQIQFQKDLMMMQISLEDHFTQLATLSGTKSVVFCDRGLMDGSAYIDPEDWQALVYELGQSVINLRDKRYDAVIHMVTAADGAREFYELASNKARYEANPQDAANLDMKLRRAWVGHPSLTIVDNISVGDFEGKIRKFFEVIMRTLGEPQNGQFYKKFLINIDHNFLVPQIPPDVRKEKFEVEETVLLPVGNARRKIIKQGQHGNYSYIYRETHMNVLQQKLVLERQITAKEYLQLLRERDDKRKTLIVHRQCFLYKGVYFRLNTYINVGEGAALLVVEKETDSKVKVEIPPFLQVVREVTDEPDYSTYIMSKRAWYAPDIDAQILQNKTIDNR